MAGERLLKRPLETVSLYDWALYHDQLEEGGKEDERRWTALILGA